MSFKIPKPVREKKVAGVCFRTRLSIYSVKNPLKRAERKATDGEKMFGKYT